MTVQSEQVRSTAEACELDAAIEQFRRLIDGEQLNRLQPMGPATVYTPFVTVWLLIYQRLFAGRPLVDAVVELVQTLPDYLPENRRVREATLSCNTSAYSRARSRLNPEVTDWLANHVYTSLVAATPPTLGNRRVYILDGTTIKLAPTPALKAAFPPARNQRGESVWPVAHLLVAHELSSGCAILPELGAMYGEQAVSEVELTKRILPRLPTRSVLMGDRNFGVFAVAYAASQAQQHVVLRLTEPRFRALLRKAEKLPESPLGEARWRLTWKPSAKERKSHPDLPAEASVEVLLHEITCSEKLTLWLVTTLPDSAADLAELYRQRQNVETDIRDVKITLKTEEIRAKSVAMLQKELATSMIAYNLVVQVRRQAARMAGVPPRRLSFSGVWSAVRIILFAPHDWTAAQWIDRFQLALKVASQQKLPNRPGRSYPRKAHPRRPKSSSGTHKPKPL